MLKVEIDEEEMARRICADFTALVERSIRGKVEDVLRYQSGIRDMVEASVRKAFEARVDEVMIDPAQFRAVFDAALQALAEKRIARMLKETKDARS